jgi:RNA polymerase sigma-70 factor, ECF subfamily
MFGYRMSGSLEYADTLMDEVLLTASRQPPPPVGEERAFLFGIATDRCISSLSGRAPRGLPFWEGPSSDGFLASTARFEDEDRWLQPSPDEMLPDKVIASSRFGPRESVSLEFVGALQRLAPPARALLLLGEVPGLGESTSGTIARRPCDRSAGEEVMADFERSYRKEGALREPPGERYATGLLMRYIFNWESGDLQGLNTMLAEDAVLQSPPSAGWSRGRKAVVSELASGPLKRGSEGRWQLLPLRANGQLAFGAYNRPGAGKEYRAQSIHVIYFSGLAITELVVFRCPRLFDLFGLLPGLVAQGENP